MPKRKRESCVHVFSIRIDGPPDAQPIIQDYLEKFFTEYVFQYECGAKNGRYHYQCYARYKHKDGIRETTLGSEVRTWFEEFDWLTSINVSCASNKGKMMLKAYAMKDETRVAGPWMDKSFEPPPVQYDEDDIRCIETNPRKYQTQILERLAAKPHHREINVVVDPTGNVGKTTLQKYLAWKGKSCQIPPGSASQIRTYVCGKPAKKVYMHNFNRAFGKDETYRDVLTAIEDVKSGWVISSMYGGNKPDLFMSRPHVWIFCNETPDTSCMSKDMWKLWSIHPIFQTLVPMVPNVPRNIRP